MNQGAVCCSERLAWLQIAQAWRLRLPGRARTRCERTGEVVSRRVEKRPSRLRGKWYLRLYVADLSPRAILALANLKEICRKHLASGYHLKVIDVLTHPRVARTDQIVALPTLVRWAPGPKRTVIGNLSDTERVLTGLGFPPAFCA